MSQLFAVMLIGRQAFLILMTSEARRLQSVSHDIHRLANPPLLAKSAFLRKLCPLGLVWQAPRARGAQQGGRRQGARVGCQGSQLKWKVGFPSSEQQALLGQPQAWSLEAGGRLTQEAPGSLT